MALSARQQWMAEKVAQSLGVELDTVRAFLSNKRNDVESFLSAAQGKQKLFFFRGKGEDQRELVLTDGSSLCLYCVLLPPTIGG